MIRLTMEMIEINEVPGALERPSGCQIRVYRQDGQYTIDIPARGASPVMWLASAGLTIVLTAWIVMGLVLLITGKPVFILAAIMTHGLTPSMYRHRFLLGGVIFAILGLGVAELVSILRQNTMRERLVIGPDGVRFIRIFGRAEKSREHPMETVRSFLLRRDPHGISPGRLIFVCRSEEQEIGEYLPNGDREWLCSVCNQLLKTR